MSRIAAAFGAVACLAGCGLSAAPQSASAGSRTVVDMTGRQVRLPSTVDRVATNIPLLPPTLYLLGGIDKLVSAAPSFTPLFTTIAPATKDVATVPVGSVDAEGLLRLHPQVFIMTSRTPQLLPTLQRLGIPVVQIADFDTAEGLRKMVGLVADVLGGDATSRAGRYGAYLDGTIRRIESRAASLPRMRRPTVYYTPGPDVTTTVGTGNIITSSIAEAGGRNLAAEHGVGADKRGEFAFPTINAETLLAWNPQVIVTIDAVVKRKLLSDRKYAALDAVRGNRVYACPVGVFAWCASSSESALAPVFLAKALHPELFADVDLGSETENFYGSFYSYRLTGRQLATILSGSSR